MYVDVLLRTGAELRSSRDALGAQRVAGGYLADQRRHAVGVAPMAEASCRNAEPAGAAQDGRRRRDVALRQRAQACGEPIVKRCHGAQRSRPAILRGPDELLPEQCVLSHETA